jgi:putative flippase GtrA
MTRIDARIPPDLGKFLVVGGIAFIVNQAVLALLYEYGLRWMSRQVSTPLGDFNLALFTASVVAVEVAIIARFLLNDAWTFRDRRDRPFWQRFIQSNLGSFGSPLISLATVNILTPVFGISYLIANAIGIMLGLAWNWGWSSRVVWRARPAEVTTAP